GFVTAHLLIKRIKELLTGGGTGERGTVIECSSEAAKVEQAFGSAIEGHAHAVEEVDDSRSSIAHSFDRWLVGQKVAAVNRVVEVLPGGVAFAFQILGGIDAALRANRMRPLHGDDREQVDVAAHLGNLDHGCQSSQSAAHDYDFRVRCHQFGSKFHRAASDSTPEPMLIGCNGVFKNEYMVAAPTTTKSSPIAKQTYPNLRRALSPVVIPHLAANSQSPYAKCHEAPRIPRA